MRVKPTNLQASLGIDHTIQGGEGVIAAVSVDTKGVYYSVRMDRKNGTRSLRKEHLIVHRPPPKGRRKK